MQFFLDTADLDEIKEAASWGAISGVTTNPSLYAKIGGKLSDFEQHMATICEIVNGPVSAEITSETREAMIEEGVRLAQIAPNIVIKIPTTVEGLAATHTLACKGVPVNMTLCFSVTQALLAARSGAAYVSPFVGRFDDIAENGLEQLNSVIKALMSDYFEPKHENLEAIRVIAASLRSPHHVAQAALMGADIATVPFKVLEQCVKHPLTDRGLAVFKEDWKKVEQA